MEVQEIIPSIACNLDADMLSASFPLLEAGLVGGMEWSFDVLHARNYQVPDWFHDLLKTYADSGRLVGHGVFFSLFAASFSQSQQDWLKRLKMLCQTYTFDHITEHFGFMTGQDFHKGAPLSVPFNNSTLSIGRDRIARIADAAQCPVGLENLAFAYDLEEVKIQGAFLDALLNPVNGFIILDLHNLFCQMHNFKLDAAALLKLYPLKKVHEIHISGGSWEPHVNAPNQKVRRDTHDGEVPSEVFDLLKMILPLCPNLKFVVMEQLGIALKTDEERIQFQEDYKKMLAIVEAFNLSQNWPKQIERFMPLNLDLATIPFEDESLAQQQKIISHVLENAKDSNEAMALLRSSAVANSDWQIENWDEAMLATAIQIAQKWK